jgi:cobalt/nickel transport system permease protein
MHIPDGFLSLPVAGAASLLSAASIGLAVRQANRKLGEKHIPLMGVMGAFIFAAQMLNFPIAGGTSGHLMGAALAAILLGPWTGLLIMTSVLIIQSLLFQDGGLIALGANVLNMGVLATFVAYLVYRAVTFSLGEGRRGILSGGFVAAWLAVVAGAAATAVELALSGTSPLVIVLPAMTGVHALIGIGEGAITVTVLSFVMATRRDLLELQKV